MSLLFHGGEGIVVWAADVQNTLQGNFGLSQEGYSVTSLQGFSNTIKCIGRDMEGSDPTEVIFGMCSVFSDGVGLGMG